MYLIEGSGTGRLFPISECQLGISPGGESGLTFCSRLEDEKWKTWKTWGPDRTSRSQISPLQTRYSKLLDLGRFLAFSGPRPCHLDKIVPHDGAPHIAFCKERPVEKDCLWGSSPSLETESRAYGIL